MTSDQYPRIFMYKRLVNARMYIGEHFAEQIDLDKIAGAACISKFHFVRQFKSIYNKTPHQYVIYLRLERAKQLLRTGVSVSEVCYAVGFESLSSFSGLFKQVHGVSPVVYLRQQQELKQRMSETPLSFVPACFAQKSGWL